MNRFGVHFADCIRLDKPVAVDKWHMDEVVIPINGKTYWLWRAVDASGDVLDILVQPQRNAKAARRFLGRLINFFGETRVAITENYAAISSRSGTLHRTQIIARMRA